MTRPRVWLAMDVTLPLQLFSGESWAALARVADVAPGPPLGEFGTDRAAAALAETEVLLTGWGCPRIDEDILDAAPRLRAIVHAAGSVKGHVAAAAWDRGIQVSSAAAANALPVAEYTVAMILLAGKRAHRIVREYRRRRGAIDLLAEYPHLGNYQRTVGVIGASKIGRRVIELLRPFDFTVLLADPFADETVATALGARLVDLDTLLAGSDVVSLHAPDLPSTQRLLDRSRLARIPDGATLINTARGALVDHDALIDELATGRFEAVLDVTDPEVLPVTSPLYALDNVVLTAHLAGAQGNELRRLADTAIAEIGRFAAGEPLHHAVSADQLTIMA
ncbi:hydroxyacid dehydrogenase [Amycolatopsis sp. CA-126428]|uniref:hydroxyacid dehydrogenase n=1 Tax=Amycolatopsis sp. CA-126428 TaxID=2073158 RepID=UPI000CD2C7F6|nr:hydroxyacid dehydrogenase [Amycolatopsis sp. CA-126428]